MIALGNSHSAFRGIADVGLGQHITAPLQGSLDLLFFSRLLAIDVIDGAQKSSAPAKLEEYDGRCRLETEIT